MNEWLLLIAVVTVILIIQFLVRHLKQPVVTYVRVTSTILLLGLIWGFAEQNKWPVKLITTVVVISGLITTVKQYQKLHVGSTSDSNR